LDAIAVDPRNDALVITITCETTSIVEPRGSSPGPELDLAVY